MMTDFSWTAIFRIAAPRRPARPMGVAICERLRMSRALLTLGAIHRRDRKLIRFLLGIEHQDLDLFCNHLQIGADFVGIESLKFAREDLFLDFKRCEVRHRRPPGTLPWKKYKPDELPDDENRQKQQQRRPVDAGGLMWRQQPPERPQEWPGHPAEDLIQLIED